jgi:hypothetical protein
MRILRPAILAAALGVAPLCGAIPAQTDGAIAAGLPSVSVRPDFAEPGETISVTASCYPGLRLVTCGGAFDYRRHEYADNVMVFASGRK